MKKEEEKKRSLLYNLWWGMRKNGDHDDNVLGLLDHIKGVQVELAVHDLEQRRKEKEKMKKKFHQRQRKFLHDNSRSWILISKTTQKTKVTKWRHHTALKTTEAKSCGQST